MVEHEPHNCCPCCGCWCLFSLLLLLQVGWRFTEEENGELSVATGGGTRIREQRTFAGRWVSRGESGRWKMCHLILLGEEYLQFCGEGIIWLLLHWKMFIAAIILAGTLLEVGLDPSLLATGSATEGRQPSSTAL